LLGVKPEVLGNNPAEWAGDANRHRKPGLYADDAWQDVKYEDEDETTKPRRLRFAQPCPDYIASFGKDVPEPDGFTSKLFAWSLKDPDGYESLTKIVGADSFEQVAAFVSQHLAKEFGWGDDQIQAVEPAALSRYLPRKAAATPSLNSLSEWILSNLKQGELKASAFILKQGGSASLDDVGVLMGWVAPLDDAAGGLCRRVSSKLKETGMGYKLHRSDNLLKFATVESTSKRRRTTKIGKDTPRNTGSKRNRKTA
jgi:hypothetical protein